MKKLLATIGADTIKGRALVAAHESAGFVIRPTAAQVTAGTIVHKLVAVPAAVEALVFSAVGTKRAWDGACTVSGQTVTVNNAGTTDWVAGDRVVIKAYFD